MYKKYILCKNNYFNIIIFSILIFSIILGLNISKNIQKSVNLEDLPENRTFFVTFKNIDNSEDIIKNNDIIIEYTMISYNYEKGKILEKYEVVINKVENINIIEKGLSDYNAKIEKKFENTILSNKIANLLYKVIEYYLITAYIFMTIINCIFVSKIVSSENKSIAILKAIGYTDNRICNIILLFITIDLVISFIISNLLYLIFQSVFNNYISNLISISNIMNYNMVTVVLSIIIMILSAVLSVLINLKKISKTSPITLFYQK